MLALREKFDRPNRARDSFNGTSDSFVSNFLQQTNTTSYEADPYGFGEVAKETSANSVKNYVYRADGKIAAFSEGSNQAGYFYDGLDRLVAKAINANGAQFTQSFVNLGQESRVLLGKAGDGSVTIYVDGQEATEHLGEVKSGAGKGYLTDQLGSVLNSPLAGFGRGYGVFGEISQNVALTPSQSPIIFGFAGYAYDIESGNYSTRFRKYNPSIGRFLSQEPTGLDGPNLYAYTHGNPLRYSDPTGLFTVVAGLGGSAAAGTGGELSGGGYINPGLFGQKGEFGVVGSVGASAGLNVSADVYGGVIFGGPENVSGTTINTNFSIGPISYTGIYDPHTGAYLGFTIGLGPSATFISASTSISSTGRHDFLQYLLTGERGYNRNQSIKMEQGACP